MTWSQHSETGWANSAVRPSLPPKLLRHLLFSHELGIGSRVLAAGYGWGDLVNFFDHLGIDAVGLEEPSEHVATEHLRTPQVEVHCGRTEGAIPLGGGRFDAVLVRRLRTHRDNLFSPAAFRTTAELLACVRPGGYLILLAQYGSAALEELPIHTSGCYRQHLAAFGGSSSTRDFPDRLTRATSWERILRRQPRSGFLTATVQLPEPTLPRSGWLRLADAAAQSMAGSCCLAATEVVHRRRAA